MEQYGNAQSRPGKEPGSQKGECMNHTKKYDSDPIQFRRRYRKLILHKIGVYGIIGHPRSPCLSVVSIVSTCFFNKNMTKNVKEFLN
jgi:hypothetical protein